MPNDADPGIVPNVRAVAPIGAEVDVVDVRPGPGLEYRDELVLGPIEGAHPAVRLVPDADVLQLGVDATPHRQQLADMAPVHADEMDGAVAAVRTQVLQDGFEEV